MNKAWVWIVIVIILGAGGYYLFMNKPSQTVYPQNTTGDSQTLESVNTTPTASEAVTKTITLAEQNESSESGTAVLTEKDGKVMVTLNLTGAPSTTPQPAHIHAGSCPDVGAVAYPLTDAVNGVSETTLDVSLADLAGKQPLGINVHKSAAQLKVYVACGDLSL